MKISKRTLNKSIYTPKRRMQISVSGTRSVRRKKILAQATEHFCSVLLGHKFYSKISVDIVIKRKLEEDLEGCCIYSWASKTRKHFVIELLYFKDIRKMLSKLAHECTHVKQYALGELDNDTSHRGKTIWMKTVVDERVVSYWDQPWEIEAFDREFDLVISFCDDYKYTFN